MNRELEQINLDMNLTTNSSAEKRQERDWEVELLLMVGHKSPKSPCFWLKTEFAI